MAMPPTARTAADPAAAVGPDILAAALAASPDGVALLDEQGRCLHVNAAGCALLGTPLADLLRAARAVRRTRRPLRRADAPTSAAPVDGPGFARGSGSWSTSRARCTPRTDGGSPPSPSGT